MSEFVIDWDKFDFTRAALSSCNYCRDTGHVDVEPIAFPEYPRIVERYGRAKADNMPASVRCTCNAGSRYAALPALDMRVMRLWKRQAPAEPQPVEVSNDYVETGVPGF